jgi:hypothetical protein
VQVLQRQLQKLSEAYTALKEKHKLLKRAVLDVSARARELAHCMRAAAAPYSACDVTPLQEKQKNATLETQLSEAKQESR